MWGWIFLFRRLWLKMPLSAHFGFFFGALTLNVVSYCRDLQTAHLWPKHAFWHIDRPDQLRNATWARGEESKRRHKEKRNSEMYKIEDARYSLKCNLLRLKWYKTCDKSHICPEHPRCASHSKVVVWGGVPNVVTSQPCQVSSKSVQAYWLPKGSKSAFSNAQCYGLYNNLGLPLNLW